MTNDILDGRLGKSGARIMLMLEAEMVNQPWPDSMVTLDTLRQHTAILHALNCLHLVLLECEEDSTNCCWYCGA